MQKLHDKREVPAVREGRLGGRKCCVTHTHTFELERGDNEPRTLGSRRVGAR